MSEEEFAGASSMLASWTLRIEYETVWSWERLSWPANVTAHPAATDTQEAPTTIKDDSTPLRATTAPVVLDPPAKSDLPAELLDDSDVGAPDFAPPSAPTVRPPSLDDAFAPVVVSRRRYGPVAALTIGSLIAAVGWRYTDIPNACWLTSPSQYDMSEKLAAEHVARRIVTVESGGNAKARNARSSATGAGQFLDGTWLDMIRAYRPDLGTRAEAEILDLRYDPEVSREMVAHFAEENAAILKRRCLPVTPGTLYLSHFAGGAGAVAVLSAPDTADAATIMADADSTGRTTREMIVTANPFLAHFSVADLKRWADRKMGYGARHISKL